ncbi:ribokinase [Sporothrix schenckii 1099-18]|uniref:Ribokinase n=1 Tax=Sporothrix schenckii 1099-18 TaxID=1397361 RepID=A0A0F2ME66_SPOSC|nr:ribokinase [Sporothrix schenckii 1099-18]KJR87958.1 ribokinase [Sporothrix schenckii 1099-18]
MASPIVGTAPVGSPPHETQIQNPAIMVIGSLNADLVTYAPRMPVAGETLAANGFRTGLGGKGANQAVACAKLGRRSPANRGVNATAAAAPARAVAAVYMVGAVGDDVYGRKMTSALSSVGVDTSGVVVRAGQGTGIAVILVDDAAGGENRILLSAEANATLQPQDYATSLPLTPEDCLPSLLLLQLEIPLSTVLQVLQTARRQGVPVLLNAAPAEHLPDDAYACITHLVVNETEASLLSGATLDLDAAADRRDSELARVAGHFLQLGVQHVVITLGGAGVYHASASTHTDSGLVPAAQTTVVDTTAAGDTFIGAYALGLVQGKTVAAAVAWANRAAAVAVGRQGAQESIPWMDEVKDADA